MSAAIQPAQYSGDLRPESVRQLCSVVRQPILDLRGRVHAYELRFRGDAVPNGEAAYNNLLEAAANLGLQKPSELKKLTGKLTAFLRCPVEALNDQLAQVLPASLTVLEIDPHLEFSPDLIATCRSMKSLGFRFALENFRGVPETRPLLELTDYIKVNFGRTSPEVRRALLNELHDKTTMLVAKNVNTHADRFLFTALQGKRLARSMSPSVRSI
jgi:EAL and modified HD-GYP domain-containing signal transduction protein